MSAVLSNVAVSFRKNKTSIFVKLGVGLLLAVSFLLSNSAMAGLKFDWGYRCETDATGKTLCWGTRHQANVSANSTDSVQFSVGGDTGILYFNANYNGKEYACGFTSAQSNIYRSLVMSADKNMFFQLTIDGGKCTKLFFDNSSFPYNLGQ